MSLLGHRILPLNHFAYLLSVSQEPATSDSRFYNGWRMPGILITYDYPVQKLERISIYIDDASTQKTSTERVYQGQIQVSH